MKHVAMIGTGIMGSHMAARLARAGYAVTAWNRTPDKAQRLAGLGVASAPSPREALAGCDAAIVMLSTGEVVDETLFAGPSPAIAALPAGSLLIVMSSVPVECARAHAAKARSLGLRYLDAPVSGGEPGARDGTLAIFVGGEQADAERARPLFAAMGQATWLGPAGSGQLTKLANQVIVGGTLVAISEALVLAAGGGAQPTAVREALMGGFGDSKVLRVLGPRMVSGDFVPGSPAKYQLKDMRAAQALANAAGVRLALLDHVIRRFEALVDHGDGDRDVSAIVREVANAAGLVAFPTGANS
jgi:3-hydroxyisobutyrate dehydrogenase-like beta-hydroxyacid dehydrogenase